MFYTGDGAARDEHGYIWIKGRVDGPSFTFMFIIIIIFLIWRWIFFFLFRVDVINVSGHRLSTAEIESALIMHKGVAETAGTFYFLIAYRSPPPWFTRIFFFLFVYSYRNCRWLDRSSCLCIRHSQTVSIKNQKKKKRFRNWCTYDENL